MTTTIPRWCANCKHGIQPSGIALMLCSHPIANQQFSGFLADGEYRLASSARNDHTTCGLDGKLWETKVVEPSLRPRSGHLLQPRRGFFERLKDWRLRPR